MTVVFLTSGSTSPWDRPSNWDDAGHTVNLVGAGGRGGPAVTGSNNRSGDGGSGGGHVLLTYSSGALASTTAFRVTADNSSLTDHTTASATCWLNSSFSNTYYVEAGVAGSNNQDADIVGGNATTT